MKSDEVVGEMYSSRKTIVENDLKTIDHSFITKNVNIRIRITNFVQFFKQGL
jgi:hypothetical protein